MDKILDFVKEVFDYFKDFKLADVIDYIKSIFSPVQPR